MGDDGDRPPAGGDGEAGASDRDRRRVPSPDGHPGAAEQSEIAFWLNHLHAGAAMYAAGVAVGAAYLHVTPDGPHRRLLWVLVALGAATVAVVLIGPREAIARSPHRLSFFLGWSLFSVAFTAVIAGVDGGLDSPLALVMLLPVLYAALAYPTRHVAGVGMAAIVAATVLTIAVGDPVGNALPFLGVMGMVGSVATFAASQRERQDQHLVTLATHDGLTGCLDHGAFYGRLEQELRGRDRVPVALVLVDVDDFKPINDRHGHLAGDDVLRTVGKALRAVTRSSDAVGRIGGDEFGLVFVDAPNWVADDVGYRIASELAKHELPCRVTISTGVAMAGPYREVSPHELVAEADTSLYAAKKSRPRLRSVT